MVSFDVQKLLSLIRYLFFFCSYFHYSESESEVPQLCLTLQDPMDCSLPGSSTHGIFQARGLEWGAIASSAFFLRSKQKTLQSFLTLVVVIVIKSCCL